MVTYYFADGGPFMFVLLVVAVAGLLSAPVAGLLHGLGHRLIAALWLAPLAGLLLAVAMAGMHGRSVLLEGITTGAPEMKQMLLAQGLTIQLYSEAFGRVLTLVVAIPLGTAVVIGHLVGTRGDKGQVTPGPAVAAGLIVMIGGLVSMAVAGARVATEYAHPMVFLTGALVVPAGLAILAVGIRADEPEERLGGTAGARFVVWACALAVAWAAAGLPTTSGIVIAFKAVATAAPEHKAEMLRHGLAVARADSGPGLWAVLGVLLSGPVLLIPCSAALKRAGVALGAAAAALLLLVGVAATTASTVWQDGSLALLMDSGLPDELNDARIACAARVSRPGVYRFGGLHHNDGSFAEPVISFVEGANSEPARECLRVKLEGFSMEAEPTGWRGYDPGWEVPPTPVEWTFEMPPGEHVRLLVRP